MHLVCIIFNIFKNVNIFFVCKTILSETISLFIHYSTVKMESDNVIQLFTHEVIFTKHKANVLHKQLMKFLVFVCFLPHTITAQEVFKPQRKHRTTTTTTNLEAYKSKNRGK